VRWYYENDLNDNKSRDTGAYLHRVRDIASMAFTNPDTVHMPQMNSHTTLQGRGTPIVSHAMPTPHPAHPPPPMSHLSNFIGGHTSQPPNPSSAAPWFNASSRSFVPRARVTLRKPDGTVVKIEDLAKASRHTTAPASPSLQHTSPHRNEIPSMPQKTNSPHLASILIESEDQRNARLAEEEKKHQEEALANAEAEKKVRKEEKEERRKRKEKERIRKEAKKAEAMRIAEEKAKKEEEQRFGAKRIAKKAEEVALAKTREDEAKRIRIEAMAIATAAAKRAAQPAPESQDDKPARRINTISPTFNLTAESINIPNPLATARIIADISSIQYLDSISGPRPELNENPKEGELQYISFT
jgi:translation initiation factor 4G